MHIAKNSKLAAAHIQTTWCTYLSDLQLIPCCDVAKRSMLGGVWLLSELACGGKKQRTMPSASVLPEAAFKRRPRELHS